MSSGGQMEAMAFFSPPQEGHTSGVDLEDPLDLLNPVPREGAAIPGFGRSGAGRRAEFTSTARRRTPLGACTE